MKLIDRLESYLDGLLNEAKKLNEVPNDSWLVVEWKFQRLGFLVFATLQILILILIIECIIDGAKWLRCKIVGHYWNEQAGAYLGHDLCDRCGCECPFYQTPWTLRPWLWRISWNLRSKCSALRYRVKDYFKPPPDDVPF